jgi:hypothetical protein
MPFSDPRHIPGFPANQFFLTLSTGGTGSGTAEVISGPDVLLNRGAQDFGRSGNRETTGGLGNGPLSLAVLGRQCFWLTYKGFLFGSG